MQLAVDGNINMEEDQDDLIDLLDRFGSKSYPKGDMKPLVLQIAHKEIIQKPKCALDKMAFDTRSKLSLYFPDPLSVEEIYEEKVPTVKKVLKIIQSFPDSREETDCLKYFQRYIKAQESPAALKRLLRFVTGSDVLTVDKITITFTNTDGLARRPIAPVT